MSSLSFIRISVGLSCVICGVGFSSPIAAAEPAIVRDVSPPELKNLPPPILISGFDDGLTTTTATLPTDGTEAYSAVLLTTGTGTDSITLDRKRINVSGTTTVYLVGQATFSVGTAGGFGSLTARRVR